MPSTKERGNNMFNFHFVYSDGNMYDVNDVTKIIVKTSTGLQEIEGDEILTAKIPLNFMYLYSQNGNVTISGTNLMVVDVLKSDS